MEGSELRHNLASFIGSEKAYFHALNRAVHYSEGVRFFAQNAGGGAYWLLDILASEPQILRGVAEHGMCVVLLQVVGSVAQLTVARDYNSDSGAFEAVAYTRQIDFTDCPEGQWKFYMIDNMIMLPSEY
jgi:hypothetical protein